MIGSRFPFLSFVVKHQLCPCGQQVRHKSDGSSVKRLNHTNKALFGSVTRNAAAPKPNDEVQSTTNSASDAPPNRNDLSSEMYWLLQHKQSTPADRKRASSSSSAAKPKTRRPVDRAPDDDVLRSLLRPIKVPRMRTKMTLAPTKNIPTTLSRFGDTLCTPPIKKLEALVAPPSLLKRSSSALLQQMMRVPPFHVDGHSFNNDEFVGCAERLEIGNMPSVGAVLQATMPEPSRRALMHWKRLKVAELGEQGFQDLQKSHLTAGSNFHSALQTYFVTKQAPATNSPLAALWSSVSSALVNVHPDPELIEAPIVHPILQYKGIVDCVSNVSGELSVIEWKKSDRQKFTITGTYDAPLQLCAYLGAINADARYALHARSGLVVIAYTTGAPAHAFRLGEMAVRQYWTAWLERLHEYWVRRRNGTLPEPI